MIYLGRYASGGLADRGARDIQSFPTTSPRPPDINVANLHYRRDRFPQALTLYERALSALREVGTPNDVAVTLRNIAVCHISLHDFARALAVHGEARTFCEAHGLARLVVEADYNIAYLHYRRGEYAVALELYQAALARAEALGDAYHRALCDLDQSELYLELNLLEEGVALAEQALAGFESLQMPYGAARRSPTSPWGEPPGRALRSLHVFESAGDVRGRGNEFGPRYRRLSGPRHHQEGRHLRRASSASTRWFFDAGANKAAWPSSSRQIHLALGELVSGRARCHRALDRLRVTTCPT